MTLQDVLSQLHAFADEERKIKMTRFAIPAERALGVTMPQVKSIAKSIKTNHSLAMQLWATQIHEAQILACHLADKKLFTAQDMDDWAYAFNAWDVCDQCCANLFIWTPFAQEKIIKYATSEYEFVKRTAYAMIATIAVHHKKVEDTQLLPYFALIKQGANDERNFVKKAVNWALRQLGKRSSLLRKHAIATAEELLEMEHKSAHWIAKDALKELMMKS